MSDDFTFESFMAKVENGELLAEFSFGPDDEPARRALKFLTHCAMCMFIGDDEELPPNYRMGEVTATTDGVSYRIVSEVMPMGHRSSHEIRRALEAQAVEIAERMDRARASNVDLTEALVSIIELSKHSSDPNMAEVVRIAAEAVTE